jgi:hypothetical protein
MIGAGSHMEDELAHRWKAESTAKLDFVHFQLINRRPKTSAQE